MSEIIETQPQVAQLDVQFRGPLVKDAMVETKEALLTLHHNYPHKLVWVKSESCYYYMKEDVDGTHEDDWYPFGKNARLEEHDITLEYTAHACVFSTEGIYVSLTEVPANTEINATYLAPNGDRLPYWTRISDNIVCIRHEFENTAEIVVKVPSGIENLENPMFQVFVDKKVVYPSIENTDIEEREWTISFYENGELSPKTGYVLIK